MSPRDWTELTAAYVLDSLDAEERAAFEQRLASDPELERDVESYREVMGALAQSAPAHAPPAALKERILVEARGQAGSAPSPEKQAGGPGGRGTVLPWLLAAAGIIVSLGLGISYQRMRTENQGIRTENATLQVAYDRVASDLAARDSLLATFLGPNVRTASLAATGLPPSARLFWNTTTGSVVVAAFDLPPAAAGRTYQLWGIVTGLDPVSLGTFQTGSDGTAIFRTPVPGGFDFELGAVTEEPAGGSPQPTSTPFLVGAWSTAP